MTSDGEEGWGLFQARHFDLVITDVRIPKLDGPGLIRRIREAGSAVPILVQTSDVHAEGASRAKEAGANLVLSYAELIRDVGDVVRQLLPEREYAL